MLLIQLVLKPPEMTTEEPLGLHCVEHDSQDRDLYIFDGMKGFEDFDPMDDSSLNAILDDLQEGTLLSLLNDNSIFNDLNEGLSDGAESSEQMVKLVDSDVDLEQLLEDIDGGSQAPRTGSGGLDDSHFNPTVSTVAQSTCTFSVGTSDTEGERSSGCCETEICESQPDVIASALSKVSSLKGSSEGEGLPATLKRTLEASPQSDQNSVVKRAKLEDDHDLNHIRACVHHDHSYTSHEAGDRRDSLNEGQRSPLGTCSSSDSVEEGNNSDAGEPYSCICTHTDICMYCIMYQYLYIPLSCDTPHRL